MEQLTSVPFLGNLNKMENLAVNVCLILLIYLLHECLYHAKNNLYNFFTKKINSKSEMIIWYQTPGRDRCLN